MAKYRLLRDCPHGKAGSMWHDRRDLDTRFDQNYEIADEDGEWWIFPKSTFSDWFEEVEEIPKFTKKQTRYLLSKLYKATEKYDHAGDMYEFVKAWVKENTEQ